MSHLLCLDPCVYIYPKVGHLPIFLKMNISIIYPIFLDISPNKVDRDWFELLYELSCPCHFPVLGCFGLLYELGVFWLFLKISSFWFKLHFYAVSLEKNHFVKTYTEFTFKYFSLNWLLLWKQRISHFFYKIC